MSFFTSKRLSKILTLMSVTVILVILTIVGKGLTSFYDYKQSVSPKMELTLDRFHFFLKNEFKREWIKITAPEPLSDEESPLKTFRITVKQKDIDSLNIDLPTSGKDHYVDAFMNVSDEPQKVRKIQLRYRGDTNLHWLYKQKSLRIKLSKNDIHNMEKKFNLVNTVHDNIIMDQVAYTIAKDIGLLTPDFEPVRVFINGKYMGVYMYLSQVDESLLRKHKVMPGSLYYGDNSPSNKKGIADLWFKSKYWEKKAARNAEQKFIREDINTFIYSINTLSENEFYIFFNTLTSKNKFFKFMALDVLFGGIHHDYVHNHKIYFDPYRGNFEPLAWDLRYWTSYSFKDASMYPLLEKIKLNPLLEYERDMMIYNLYQKYTPEKINSLLNTFSGLQYKDLEADIYKDTGTRLPIIPDGIAIPFSMSEYDDSIKKLKITFVKRYNYLTKLINSTDVKHKIERFKKYNKFTVYVSGNSPIKIINNKSKIILDTNFNDIKDSDDKKVSSFILYPGKKFQPGNTMKQSSFNYGDKHLVPSKLKYTFFIKNEFDTLKITNALTNKIITSQETTKSYEIVSDSIHPWKLPQPKYKTKILSGDIEVKETLVFDKHTTVKIEPNTTFNMYENSSIYFYGKVEAIGTKEKPIKFIAKDPNKPWGLVAVQGQATSGSKFHHVEFSNGSVDTRNLIRYTAPFNIHDTKDFEVKNCFIGKNHIGDDAMHIAYANGIVDGCVFDGARSDGLDIDIADVTVANSIFVNSGNDGLDVMTTKINAFNNIFIDTGDKGISVGEWSEANITNSFFLRTVIGTEIKDKSKVKADNLIFVDSKEKAINLYNKNKRYDTGGFLNANQIYLMGNSKVTADKKSEFKIKERIENTIPKLKDQSWYKNLENIHYKDLVEQIEVKYEK